MASFFFPLRHGDGVADCGPARAAAIWRRWFAALLVGLSIGVSPQWADAGTLVNFNTQLGTIQIDLFDDLAPATVDNFLSYANSGAYTDTAIHRSTSIADSGLAVIQGGGFNFNSTTGFFDQITTASPINLQYTVDNTRGTIAMARTSDPNSATSQWFINTVDNSSTLGPSNGGGFAVFGWIVGKGLPVAQEINDLPKQGVGQFGVNVPLKNFTGGTPTEDNLVFVNSVTVVGEHAAFQNPVMMGDVINDGVLRVSDVHAVITDILVNGSHDVAGPFSGGRYLDVNGNGRVSIADLNNVINSLLSGGQSQSAAPAAAPLAAPLSATAFSVVPEPTSLSLGAMAALALAAAALWRRRRQAVVRAG